MWFLSWVCGEKSYQFKNTKKSGVGAEDVYDHKWFGCAPL